MPEVWNSVSLRASIALWLPSKSQVGIAGWMWPTQHGKIYMASLTLIMSKSACGGPGKAGRGDPEVSSGGR